MKATILSDIIIFIHTNGYTKQGGGFSCLRDRLLKNFQPIKIAKRSYWLNAFLTKSKSKLSENVLNQWKVIKNITNCGVQPQNYSDKHQAI